MMLVNGAPSEFVPATDRGFCYGDGVFRTLCARDGSPRHWNQHYAKLAQDCAALALPCPARASLLAEVRAAAAGYPQAAVRITVTRGGGARGYAPPSNPQAPLRVVSAAAYSARTIPHAGVRLHLCHLRLAHQPALAGVKHLNRLENVLARSEWTDPDIAEGLLLDQQGLAIGGTMSNLFVVEGDVLLTPLLDQCGVAGVTRARVMRAARARRIACREDRLPLERVLAAREVFLVNSLIGLWPVARLDEHAWPAAVLAPRIAQALKADDDTLA